MALVSYVAATMNQEITFSSSAFIPLKSGMFSLSVVRLLLSQVGNQRYYLSRVSQALDCGGSYFFSLGRPQSTLFGRNAIIGSIEITLRSPASLVAEIDRIIRLRIASYRFSNPGESSDLLQL